LDAAETVQAIDGVGGFLAERRQVFGGRTEEDGIVSKIRGGVSLTGPGLSRKMWGRKIRPRRLSAIFLPGIFLLPPIFERIRKTLIIASSSI
jgi:hypothetical protein